MMPTKGKAAATAAMTTAGAGAPAQSVLIAPPNFQYATVQIVGMSPYVMNKMSSTNRKKMMDNQMSGQRSKKGAKREPKNFDAVYKGAMHVSRAGWLGIPASSFRTAMISACRVVGFQMTKAKLCVFVEGDDIDADDGQPLIKIKGTPRRRDMAVKLADGSTDILARPFFDEWSAAVRLKWDGDMFSASDVLNLLARVGQQVGIGAGRPDSKNSCGMGWGTFAIADDAPKARKAS